ncbi:MAG: WecB/TagA/CpsF family glycosyltransferase [Oscillospiraceae bacterium]|jgi:N-acetylglucosaminyldiphosphoundecaprenol N-acetyl-beta-D-mannosaminyltransferase|nr:WecB/TagA/CpsF family glycosyltransferase [Oscillospiraceae bacterium]
MKDLGTRVRVLGVGFDSLTLDGAADAAAERLYAERPDAAGYVVTPNPEIVQICRRDAAARAAADGAFLVLADGIGVVYAARILGLPLRDRVPGIDFAAALLARCEGTRVFLLGAKPGVAEAARARLAETYPAVLFVGCADGYFTDDGAVIAEINAAAPDLLFVCLGAPKQELWMAENAARLKVKLCVGLGGALDVFAGTVRRAPEAWRRLGLEWLYRLLREPRRIARMWRLPLFLVSAALERLRGNG